MKQKLESIINKGRIIALASIVALAINCQPLYKVEPEIKEYTNSSDDFCYDIGDTYKIFDRYVPLLKKQGAPLEIGESCQLDEEVCESCY